MKNIKINRIRSFRIQKDLSVVELAKMLNVSRQAVYLMEKKQGTISPDLEEKLTNIFNCTVDELYSEPILEQNKYIVIEYINDLNVSKNNESFCFDIKFLDTFLKRMNYSELFITTYNNNLVIVDRSDKLIKHRSIYVIKIADVFYFLQIFNDNPLDNNIRLVSVKDDENINTNTTVEEIQDKIIGKIIYTGIFHH